MYQRVTVSNSCELIDLKYYTTWYERFQKIWRNTHSGTDGRTIKQYAACMRDAREGSCASVHDRNTSARHVVTPQFPTTTHGNYWIKKRSKTRTTATKRQWTSSHGHPRILVNKTLRNQNKTKQTPAGSSNYPSIKPTFSNMIFMFIFLWAILFCVFPFIF